MHLNKKEVTTINELELYHHGILGQRWGVRRFQNKDGSLTSAGKTRYSKENRNDQVSERINGVKDELIANFTTARLVAAGVSRHRKKKFDAEKEKEQIDEKTGFHLKDSEMSMEEDLKRINPSIYNFKKDTKHNCMLCSCTYDLRRRGYDVEANRSPHGFTPEDLQKWYPKAKIKEITGIDEKEKYSSKKSCELFVNEVLHNQGEGSRGNLMITWKGMLGGHSVAYEVKNGEVLILDGQTNDIYKPEKFFKQVNPTINFVRLDNIKFDNKKIKEVAS